MWLEQLDGIFVINLPTRADRRLEIDHQLRRLGLSLSHERVILFSAVRPIDAGGFPSIGARGCFMSHLEVIRLALSKGMHNILILEDDCDFSKDSMRMVHQISVSLQEVDWSLFYGGALNSFDSKACLPGLDELAPASGMMGSHCIAIRGEALPLIQSYFDQILQRPPGHPDGGPMHVDGAYSRFRKDNPDLKTFIAKPEWAFQRSSATDIHDKQWFDRWPVFAKLISLVRKVKNTLR